MGDGEEKCDWVMERRNDRFLWTGSLDRFCVCVLGGGLLQHDVSLNTICHLSNVVMSTQFVTHDSDKTCNHCTFFPSQIKHVINCTFPVHSAS